MALLRPLHHPDTFIAGVVAIDRIQWSRSTGMPGRVRLESVVAIDRNTQVDRLEIDLVALIVVRPGPQSERVVAPQRGEVGERILEQGRECGSAVNLFLRGSPTSPR